MKTWNGNKLPVAGIQLGWDSPQTIRGPWMFMLGIVHFKSNSATMLQFLSDFQNEAINRDFGFYLLFNLKTFVFSEFNEHLETECDVIMHVMDRLRHDPLLCKRILVVIKVSFLDWLWLYVWLYDWLYDWLPWLTDCTTDWLYDWLTALTDWMYDWLTDCMYDWLTDWLTVRLTDCPDWLNVWLTDCMHDWLTDCTTDWLPWLTECMTDWLYDWRLTVWLTECMTDWLIRSTML